MYLVYLMSFDDFTKSLSDAVFGFPLIILLLGAGVYFSIRTRFVQVRRLGLMVKLLFTSKETEKGISSFQAFAISVAGRVGTGNIAGVATAIALGGPGALFWMWIVTIIGAATGFVESTLSQIYKKEIDGEYRGGPAYYFEKIYNKRWIGVLFAIITIITMSVLLPGVQSNTIASAIQQAFVSDTQNVVLVKIIIGVVLAIVLAAVILGGTKRLGHVAEVVAPIMSIIYVLIALIIIVFNLDLLPAIFSQIFKYAFTPIAGFGGVVGTAIINGVKRGLFSNEAGQGSGPHAAAAADVKHPAEQGLVQALSVHIDTIVICTATGLMILITGAYYLEGANGVIANTGGVYGDLANSGIEIGIGFTQEAVSSLMGTSLGYKFVAIAVLFFAFTTLMAYYYMAETNIVYLTAKKDKNGVVTSNKLLTNITRFLFFAVIIGFTAPKATAIFNIADTGVGLMTWVNVIGMIFIAAPVFKVLKDYEQQLKANPDQEPIFDPEKLGIKNTEVWK